jgi:hypothetical protein
MVEYINLYLHYVKGKDMSNHKDMNEIAVFRNEVDELAKELNQEELRLLAKNMIFLNNYMQDEDERYIRGIDLSMTLIEHHMSSDEIYEFVDRLIKLIDEYGIKAVIYLAGKYMHDNNLFERGV